MPQCPEDYIHRIGRTGRAGAEGFSLCLVTPKETKNWKIINKFANTSEGISDQDRATLSHKGPRRGDRQGRGGRSFGQRSDRSGRPRFGGNRDRRSDDHPFRERQSFKKDRTFESDGAQESGFEKKRFFKKDRPFTHKKPFFNERPSFFEGQEEEQSFARKPRFNRFENDSAPRFERSNNRSNDFPRPFRKNKRDGESFEKPFGRSFSQDQDKPFFKRHRNHDEQGGGFFKKRSFFEEGSSSAEGNFVPKKRGSFKPYFDRSKDQGQRTFKRKKND